jgi:LPXTG-motif cell wall-anchored protein
MGLLPDGRYMITFIGVAGGQTIEFKIVEDHSWEHSFGSEGDAPGSSNCEIEITEDNSAVTIYFDPATGEITYEVVAPEIEPTEAPTEAPTTAPTEAPTTAPTEAPTEAVEHTYFAVGAAPLFDPSWTPNEAKYQLVKGEDGIFSVIVPVTEDMWDSDVDYKVAQDGTWDVSYNETGLAEGIDSNAHLYIPDGTVAVKITFDPATLCAAADCLTEEEPTAPTEEATEAPTTAPTEEATEASTTAPTEETTEASTTAPSEETTEAPTTVSTEAPTGATNATNATVAPTQSVTSATNATNATSSNNSNGNSTTTTTTSSTTGKVATGDSTSVAILLAMLMMAAGAVVAVRRKHSSK